MEEEEAFEAVAVVVVEMVGKEQVSSILLSSLHYCFHIHNRNRSNEEDFSEQETRRQHHYYYYYYGYCDCRDGVAAEFDK